MGCSPLKIETCQITVSQTYGTTSYKVTGASGTENLSFSGHNCTYSRRWTGNTLGHAILNTKIIRLLIMPANGCGATETRTSNIIRMGIGG